jgi:hypothetical protein
MKGKYALANLHKESRCRIVGHGAIPLIQILFYTPFSIYGIIRLIEGDFYQMPASASHLQSLQAFGLTFVTLLVLRIHGADRVQIYLSCVCCCKCTQQPLSCCCDWPEFVSANRMQHQEHQDDSIDGASYFHAWCVVIF